jgi:transposase InsO family protein
MQQHLSTYSIKALCEALQVSRSGFHAWCHRPVSEAGLALSHAIADCHAIHQARVGAPSISADVQAQGFDVSVRTVGRIMQRLGLRAKYSRKFKRTTDSNHKYGASPHLLNRDFTATRPNQVWVGDITYVRTDEGWLYLAVMLDIYSRQVVGWQMSHRIDRHLVCDALQAALMTRGIAKQPLNDILIGLMVHSDQGVQYASGDYREMIKDYGLTQSMSRRGNCWDNAVAESFFATLKKQAIYGEHFLTREAARQHIFEYIECYYNRVRRHSTNGWMSPVDFEAMYYKSIEGVSV